MHTASSSLPSSPLQAPLGTSIPLSAMLDTDPTTCCPVSANLFSLRQMAPRQPYFSLCLTCPAWHPSVCSPSQWYLSQGVIPDCDCSQADRGTGGLLACASFPLLLLRGQSRKLSLFSYILDSTKKKIIFFLKSHSCKWTLPKQRKCHWVQDTASQSLMRSSRRRNNICLVLHMVAPKLIAPPY